MSRDSLVLPGAAVGVLGSGQLGRMLAFVARRMGYSLQVYSPDEASPAGQFADREWVGAYEDLDRVAEFARAVDVVTVEFENIPAATLATVSRYCPTRPGADVVATAQHRGREKAFLSSRGFPVAPFAHVAHPERLEASAGALGYPLVMKTAGFGYDGKGQRLIRAADELSPAYDSLGRGEVVIESLVRFAAEAAVVVARGVDGNTACFDVIQTRHEHHILDIASAPTPLPAATRRRATELAIGIAEDLGVIGVLCVELFVLADGDVIVNELAPRPHNSAHLTIEAAVTSQFEQQLRAICGLPLGDPSLLRPAAMANLLGDLWSGGEPAWERVAEMRSVALHLYGKRAARPGRKMGHLTALADTAAEAEARVREARSALVAAGGRTLAR